MSVGVLLDTNVPSETLRPMPHPMVTSWVEAQSEIEFVSVVSIGAALLTHWRKGAQDNDKAGRTVV